MRCLVWVFVSLSTTASFAGGSDVMDWRLENRPPMPNVVGPLEIPDQKSTPDDARRVPLPIADVPFIEHVRMPASESDWPQSVVKIDPATINGLVVTAIAVDPKGGRWAGTADGLFSEAGAGWTRYPTYGFNGPLSNVIADVAFDSRGTLWVATPAGLSALSSDGKWRTIRGREGLPWEALTSIAITKSDELWFGSTRGLILFKPYAEGRQWYYRAGERYLPGDNVSDVAASEDGKSVFAKTDKGIGRIDAVERTLYSKAEAIETRFEERHRRLGMPSPAQLDDAYAPKTWIHEPQPSDGLWTSYHVAAMSMAYAVTGEERYREAAKRSMEALYLLQNVTGIPGLVARSVIASDEPYAPKAEQQQSWHKTADGKYYWRDDVSSDQIDGHYFAFYCYYEHIARHNPEEKARLEKQIRQVTDYIVGHNYEIIDWNGKHTLWGWYGPDPINNQPIHYLESSLYSLMILSHLQVAMYVTNDQKYLDQYRALIEQHGYLGNLLLEKKLFPDELNHSDDQLSAIAYYPFIQLARDPIVQNALHRACRRHAFIELPERNSLFAFTYATIDRSDADVVGGVQTLREMPLDRRNWAMVNSVRADVQFQEFVSRVGGRVLTKVLPADERDFERWNQDPYRPDSAGDGSNEGSGEHYLLPYWMARFHGLIAAPR